MAQSKKRYNKNRSINKKKKRSRLQRGGFKGTQPAGGWGKIFYDVVSLHPINPFNPTRGTENSMGTTPICDWSKNKGINEQMFGIHNKYEELKIRICEAIQEKILIIDAIKKAFSEFNTDVIETYSKTGEYREVVKSIEKYESNKNQNSESALHEGIERNPELESQRIEIITNRLGEYLLKQKPTRSLAGPVPQLINDFSTVVNSHMNEAITKINTRRMDSKIVKSIDRNY